MVSAVKVGGERLYKKALRGEEVQRAPRRVTVYSFELIEFDEEGPTGEPEAALEVKCSAGTYVRTLVHDIGAALGCGAHLISLRRIAAGGWGEDDAVALDFVGPGDLRPLSDAVRDLPAVEVDDEGAGLVANGRPLPARADVSEDGLVAVLSGGDLLGVYRRRGQNLVADRVVPR
jgi:tRNA pseudouridine55 synthase